MNILAALFRPQPAPVRFIVATREESAKVRTKKVEKRLELEMLKIHTPPDQFQAAIDRASFRSDEQKKVRG